MENVQWLKQSTHRIFDRLSTLFIVTGVQWTEHWKMYIGWTTFGRVQLLNIYFFLGPLESKILNMGRSACCFKMHFLFSLPNSTAFFAYWKLYIFMRYFITCWHKRVNEPRQEHWNKKEDEIREFWTSKNVQK